MIFFQNIPRDFLERLEKKFQVVSYKPQSPIIQFGEPVDSILLILEGSAQVLIQDKTIKLRDLGAGSVLGETSLFIPQKLATAHVDGGPAGCRLLVMPKAVIQEDVLTNHQLAASFYRGMCVVMAEKLNQTNQLVGQDKKGAS